MSILIKNVILENEKKDILIEGNEIKRIEDNIDISASEIIDVSEKKAIIPGFVNCHTHLAMTLLRGFADDLSLNEWLFNRIIPAEEKLTEEDIYWGTKLALIEMIKSGTTFVNEMYLFRGLKATARAVEEIGIRANIGLCLDNFNFEKIKNSEIPENTELIDYSLAPHAIYTTSPELLKWVKEVSDKNKMLIHMHLSETQKEVQDSIENYGKRPANYLNDIGLLSDKCIFAHSVWLNNEELEVLKDKGCSLVYNPCSNMKLASGVFRLEDIKNKGINICLGTDGAASNNNLNMIEEMKTGALLQKINNIDPIIASADYMFKVATENGAKALHKKTGKIEEGYLADLVLVDLDNIYFNPCFNFNSSLVYAASNECIQDVICNGKIIMRDRKIDGEKEVLEKVKAISKKF